MESFNIITKNCIETVYAERRRLSSTRIERLKVTCAEYWAIFKFNLFHNYLKFRSWFTLFAWHRWCDALRVLVDQKTRDMCTQDLHYSRLDLKKSQIVISLSLEFGTPSTYIFALPSLYWISKDPQYRSILVVLLWV